MPTMMTRFIGELDELEGRMIQVRATVSESVADIASKNSEMDEHVAGIQNKAEEARKTITAAGEGLTRIFDESDKSLDSILAKLEEGSTLTKQVADEIAQTKLGVQDTTELMRKLNEYGPEFRNFIQETKGALEEVGGFAQDLFKDLQSKSISAEEALRRIGEEGGSLGKSIVDGFNSLGPEDLADFTDRLMSQFKGTILEDIIRLLEDRWNQG